MFSIHCPVEDAEVLLWTSNVVALHNTAEGIVVAYRCHCGHTGLWHTGRRAPAPVAA